MRRGEVWTIAGGKDYAAKPRPAVIIQADAFDDIESITICPLTSNHFLAPLVRLPVLPSEQNGLRTASSLMVDKIYTVPRSKLGSVIGQLAEVDMVRLNQAVMIFLGLI